MARLFSSGFELNSATSLVEWQTTGSPTISTSNVRTGTYAGAITSATDSIFKGFIFQYAAADTNGPVWLRFYLYISSAPNLETTIAGIQRNTGFENLTVTLTTTRTLKLFTQDGATQIGSASSALNTSQWYRIEMKMDNSPATGSKVGELKIDGTVSATSSTLTSTNMTGGTDTINLGANLEGESCTTLNIQFDDVAFNDGTGSFQTTYPGAGSLEYLFPNAAGDNNAFSVQVGGTAGSANNFTRVDEIPPDDATSYNGDVLSGDIDDFNITNTSSAIDSGATINVVHVGVRYRAVVAAAEAAFKARIKKAAAGTVTSSAAITPNTTTWNTNANAVPRLYPLTLYQDPDSSNWTKSTLDTTQIGYTISTTNTNAADITAVWAVVDYTPGTAPVVSVGDTATTSETVKLQLVSFVSPADTATTSETVNVVDVDQPNIGDMATTSETVTVLIPTYLINVGDTATTSESVSGVEIYSLIISETTTTSETVGYYSDTVFTLESIHLTIVNPVSTSSIKTWNGLARASIKTWDSLADALVKTWNGLP